MSFQQSILNLYRNPIQYRSTLFLLGNDLPRLQDFYHLVTDHLHQSDQIQSWEEIQIFLDICDLQFEIENPNRTRSVWNIVTSIVNHSIQLRKTWCDYPSGEPEEVPGRSNSPLPQRQSSPIPQ